MLSGSETNKQLHTAESTSVIFIQQIAMHLLNSACTELSDMAAVIHFDFE